MEQYERKTTFVKFRYQLALSAPLQGGEDLDMVHVQSHHVHFRYFSGNNREQVLY